MGIAGRLAAMCLLLCSLPAHAENPDLPSALYRDPEVDAQFPAMSSGMSRFTDSRQRSYVAAKPKSAMASSATTVKRCEPSVVRTRRGSWAYSVVSPTNPEGIR